MVRRKQERVRVEHVEVKEVKTQDSNSLRFTFKLSSLNIDWKMSCQVDGCERDS